VLVLPPAIQGGEKIMPAGGAVTAQSAVGLQREGLARAGEQHIVAALRCPGSGAFEEERISFRGGLVQTEGEVRLIRDRDEGFLLGAT